MLRLRYIRQNQSLNKKLKRQILVYIYIYIFEDKLDNVQWEETPNVVREFTPQQHIIYFLVMKERKLGF